MLHMISKPQPASPAPMAGGSFGLSPSQPFAEMNARRRAMVDRAIARAEAFDLTHVVDRYCRDHEVPRDLGAARAREMLRYLVLCALNPRAGYGMAGKVDDVWHTFIIFTHEYTRFCEEVAGRYIHHAPNLPDADEEGGDPDAYRQMLTDYELVFGDEPPAEHWPLIASSCSDSSCNGNCAMSCMSCFSCASSCSTCWNRTSDGSRGGRKPGRGA